MEKSIDHSHDPFLPELRQKLGKIVLAEIVTDHGKSQFYPQGMTVPSPTQPIHKFTQPFVNKGSPLCPRRENIVIIRAADLEDDLAEFGGGDRREEAFGSGI